MKEIIIKGAREHNLKNIDLAIPRDRFVVITGLSGSGKSSLAFDTIYAEGQRRYVESLSAYARQFLGQMDKPDVDVIEGLSPAISIEQKNTSRNPRSTVATVTEIYDYLRLLYARIGRPYCFKCGKLIAAQTIQQMVDALMQFPEGDKIQILSPIIRGRKGEHRKELAEIRQKGFCRLRMDGKMVDLTEDPPPLAKNRHHTLEIVVDRLVVKAGLERRLAESLELAVKMAGGTVIVLKEKEEFLFSEHLACLSCNVSYPGMEPRLFSFNSPHGACPACDGLGTKSDIDPALVVPDTTRSIREGAIRPWEKRGAGFYYEVLESLAEHYRFDLRAPFDRIPLPIQKALLYGSGTETLRFYYEKEGRREYYARPFEGVIPNLERRYRETDSSSVRAEISAYMGTHPCPTCGGSRLKPESLAIKINEKSIAEVTCLSIQEALQFVLDLTLTEKERLIATPILKEVRERLGFLVNVGVDYLTLNRCVGTLSGGEGQRIRLATQIGSSLIGVLYILDEPSIGLHQRDNLRLLQTLLRLRDIGNTVLVVEHDSETMRMADWIVDMGPGAGVHGGEVVAQGTPEVIMGTPRSETGLYLSGARVISLPDRRRKARGFLNIKGASEHNLKNISVQIPLGLFTCVTGVSGSGKSTLVLKILYSHLAQHLRESRSLFTHRPGACQSIEGMSQIDKVIHIDQSPIGRTPRSNAATYTGLLTFIRDLFAVLPQSRMRGYKAGRYSFNIKGGRCEACQGDGLIKIEMHFLPDIYVTCEVCQGKRYNRETLDIRYREANIADVLNMTVDEAWTFFEPIPSIREKLATLQQVGLNYLRLGQAATTLSGGEAQRLKLSKELSRRATGKTLYILDEPTTGLHFADIQRLLNILNQFAEAGNTVVVIEHNLDVIRNADWVIDLGPEGGERGGEVIAMGTPHDIEKTGHSYTGQFLKKMRR